MQRLSYLCLVMLLITSCCEESVVQRLYLTPYERSLWPYTEDTDVTFLINGTEPIEALCVGSQPQISQTGFAEHGCEMLEYEHYILNTQFDLNPEETLFIQLFIQSDRPSNVGYSIFTNQILSYSGALYTSNPDLNNLDEFVENISFQDTEINEAVRFTSYDSTALIREVIYSPGNGLEVVIFNDGSYFQAQD